MTAKETPPEPQPLTSDSLDRLRQLLARDAPSPIKRELIARNLLQRGPRPPQPPPRPGR